MIGPRNGRFSECPYEPVSTDKSTAYGNLEACFGRFRACYDHYQGIRGFGVRKSRKSDILRWLNLRFPGQNHLLSPANR